MTWYADLSPCTYFSLPTPLTAVGWLDPAHPYATGAVATPTVATLMQLLVNPWEPLMCMGYHRCGWCGGSHDPTRVPDGPEDRFPALGSTVNMGCANLIVPGDGVVYVAPSLILHYIEAHSYQPPAAFLAAVEACPPMASPAYFEALDAHNAGRWGGGANPRIVVVAYADPARNAPDADRGISPHQRPQERPRSPK